MASLAFHVTTTMNHGGKSGLSEKYRVCHVASYYILIIFMQQTPTDSFCDLNCLCHSPQKHSLSLFLFCLSTKDTKYSLLLPKIMSKLTPKI